MTDAGATDPDQALRTEITSMLRTGGDLTETVVRNCVPGIIRAARAMAQVLSSGGKLLVLGNGGSAADAQHFAAEFVGRFLKDRPALAAIALTTDTSALTAIGNDYGFDQIFSRQVDALGRPGDLCLAISTSGRSPNVLLAVERARSAGLVTVALTGGGESPLGRAAAIEVAIPSVDTPRVQEFHLAVEHILSAVVERLLFPVETGGLCAVGDVAPLRPPSSTKVTDLEALCRERERWRRQGRRVVWTNGCFDLLHVGHLTSLTAAAGLGDVLVVGVNDDAGTARLKGPGRPVVPATDRAELVAGLEVVDRVLVFSEDTPERVLSQLQPEVHAKGADYVDKLLPERAVVEAYGGRVEFIELRPSVSTTDLVDRVTSRHHQPGG